MPTARLSIPPLPEQVRTARLVAGAAARRAGVDPSALDDVRLAVAEAVARAVLRAGDDHPEPVQVSMTDTPGQFEIAVTDPVGGHLPDDEEELALSLITALADSCRLEDNDDGGQTVLLCWPTHFA